MSSLRVWLMRRLIQPQWFEMPFLIFYIFLLEVAGLLGQAFSPLS